MLRFRLVAMLAVLATVCSTLTLTATAATAQVVDFVDATVEEQALLALHNEARAADGDAALVRNGELDAIAREWAQHMANTSTLVHRTDYLAQIRSRVTPSPTSWGENVAFGEGVLGTAAVAHQGFMDSPGHRRNILDGNYNQVGIGMVWQNGTLWTAVNFLEAPIDTGQTTPSPTPAPTHTVTSRYTATEYQAVRDAAAYLGMSPSSFQTAGVHVLRFLNFIVGNTEGTSPDRVVVPTAGPHEIASSWVGEDHEALTWVSGYYQLREVEAQKAGAALLVFLVGLERSLS